MDWEKILKWVIFAGVGVLLYIPFIVSGDLFFPFITGKAYTFRIVTEIIFFLWIILAIINPEYRPKKNWLIYSFGAFLISILISAFLGIDFTNSIWSNYERMEGWVTIAHLFGLFIAFGSVLNKKENWIWVFNVSIIAGIFMALSALGQIFEEGIKFRVDTTLGNSTYVAVYMLFNAFLSLYLLLKEKITISSWRLWVYGIAFILNALIVFQTQTRGSMLGMFGGLILIGLIITFLNKENKILKRISIGVIVAIIAIISSIFIFKESDLIKTNPILNRIASISASEGTAQARILNWQMATEGFKERPIFGWGQSNFNYVFDKHYLPEHHGNETWFDRVHNIFFDWLIAGGIFGLALYLSIWVIALYLLWKSSKFNINEKAVLTGLGAAYFFHNFFVFDQIVSYIYFIFILAFIYSQSHQDRLICETEISDSTKYVAISIFVILMPITIYAVNYENYKANINLIDGMRTFKQTPDGRMSYYYEEGLEKNLNLFKEAIALDTFGNPEIRYRIGGTLGNISRIKEIDQNILNQFAELSVSEMEKQVSEKPFDSKYFYILGTLYQSFNDIELAEKNLLRAIELSPNKPAIRIPLIRAYINSGQKEKALKLAEETHMLKPEAKDLWAEYVFTLGVFEPEKADIAIKDAISKGENEKVENLLKMNLQNNPDKHQNFISLAAFYFQIGNKSEAILILEEVKKRFPDLSNQADQIINDINAGGNPLGKEV